MTTADPALSGEPIRVALPDVELAVLTSPSFDDADRPLAICVHGFPDSAHTWRHLTPALEEAGYRVAAPFLRGYAPSSVPADMCVQVGASASDLLALHDRLGADERAVLIGHDWGAPIVYGAAASAPDKWSQVVGMAVPPGGAMGASFLTNTDQLKRSWYMFFFQHALADLVVPADDLAFIDMIWADWSPGHDASADLPRVKDALRDPSNLAAALGMYRATLGDGPTRDDYTAHEAAEPPPQPVLYLHGAADGCIGPEVAESARSMSGDNVTVELVAGTGHFLHLEDPATVNSRIVEFLS